jgi:hypothetical protein
MIVRLTDKFGESYVLLEPIEIVVSAFHGTMFEAPYFNVKRPDYVDECGAFRLDTSQWEPVAEPGQIEMAVAA